MKKTVKLIILLIMIGAIALQTGCQNKKNPQATIEMEGGGTIVVELLPKYAPNTVNNFIALAQDGFYDGLIFHRVIEGFVIQGGDPTGSGMGGPGYSIKGEFADNGFSKNTLSHVAGVISMARSGNPDSAGSQFFICDGDCRMSLDGGYAGFGRVISGMEVVHEIAGGPSTGGNEGTALEPQIMKKVTIETFGVDYPKPQTISE